jgi:hypothetical protein
MGPDEASRFRRTPADAEHGGRNREGARPLNATPPNRPTPDAAHGSAAGADAPHVTLLGPQRFERTLAEALRTRGLSGPVALVTAGWQERETEDAEIREHLGGAVVNLELHARAERVFDRDPRLAAAHRARQETLRAMRELYNVRLAAAVDAARQLLKLTGDARLIDPERHAAIETLRSLDAEYLTRIDQVHSDFEAQFPPSASAAVQHEVRDLRRLVDGCAALAVSGGHVAVLLNRLRLLGFRDLAAGKPLFAWSAGAMAMTERIVLFYDDPPYGPGNAEVFESGLGICRGLVPLPHADERLHLDDRARVALFARRFAPAACLTLHRGSRLDWRGDVPVAVVDAVFPAPHAIQRLTPDGDVTSFEGFA